MALELESRPPTLKSTLSDLHIWVRRFHSWEDGRLSGLCRRDQAFEHLQYEVCLVDEQGPVCVEAVWICAYKSAEQFRRVTRYQ